MYFFYCRDHVNIFSSHRFQDKWEKLKGLIWVFKGFFGRGIVNALLYQDKSAIRRTYLSLFSGNVISYFPYCMTLHLISIVCNVLLFD